MKTSLVIFLLALTLVAAQAEPMPDDFAWFGSLGFTDVKDAPFSRVFWGWTLFSGGKREENWRHGFLLEDTPKKIRVLSLDLQPYELPKERAGKPTEYRHEPGDLRAYAESVLRPLDSQDHPFRGRSLTGGPHFSDRTRWFVLAWMCSRKGFDDLAAQLYAAARAAAETEPYSTRENAPSEKYWSFRHKLERDVGHFEMWRTVVAFDDPAVSRADLLARLRALAARFPHCEHLERAASLVRTLERMIAEDAAHPSLTMEEIGALPRPAQAKEWLFRLRDQNGQQHSQPGWVNIFETADMGTESPAHQLARLGDAAVPALIAALDDSTLTRSVGYGRDFVFSHEIITTGDAALKIIERIAGREFYRSGSVQGTMARDGEAKPVRAAVEAWWDEHQRKGALGELAEATARGGFSAASAGKKLLAEFPDHAATPILAGTTAAKDEDERIEFVRLVAKLKDKRALEFLVNEAREGPLPRPRVQAAWQLASRGRLDGIAPLIELWRASARSGDSHPESLINVLAMTDSPDGIRALAEGLRRRSDAGRSRVLQALEPEYRPFALMHLGDYERKDGASLPLSAASAAAVEDLLVSELDDPGEYHGSFGHRDRKRLGREPMCDEAAWLLQSRWPDRYAFDIAASYPTRTRQRIAGVNTWREAHGRSLLPLPAERPLLAKGEELKIAEVVFAGDAVEWPERLPALLRAAQGRTPDADLFRGFERAFLEACGGKAPGGDLGFAIDAFRENETDGVTMIVTRAERHGLAQKPERKWRLDYRAAFSERKESDASCLDLFSTPSRDSDRAEIGKIFREIAALQPKAPFHLHMELAPQRWDVDDAF